MDLTNFYGFNILMIFINTVIALIITLITGKLHEVLHAFRAKQLGYKVKKISLWKNEVDIEIEITDPNFKRIGRFPYYVFIPTGFIIIILGYYMFTIYNPYFLGILVSGIAIVFLHFLSMRFEGKDVNRKMFNVQDKESNNVVSKK